MSEKKLEIVTKKYRGETATVTARLSVELIERLDEIVEKTGRTRNEIIQRCVEYAVDNIKITEE
ncbi:MAG: ribbon-helix-helix protein, CopG family [Lachnospiraceae bacterium]|nr:ribbon-helix-helix protein, CopG family [Lachnospiraceae bacterium]